MTDLAIGIDLGTSNSCVACYRNGIVEVLQNAEEQNLTPSCVFFLQKPGQPPIVGSIAKKMSEVQPSNGIYEIKRFVGKRFNEIKNRLEYFSFDVEKDEDDNPIIVIDRKNEVERKTPQEICTTILSKLKHDAEKTLGEKINKAVITVPAYFSSIQREVTLNAAQKAGFTVLQLFNEPTAAALSYYFNTEIEIDGYTLIYDLGSGTFDVSVLKGTSKKIDIVGVDGDTNLGGKDFDNIIIDYVCQKLEEEYKFNIKIDRREMRRLQNICEEAKKELSAVEETLIILPGFLPNKQNVTIKIEREDFVKKAEPLFKRTIEIVSRCLDKNRINKNQIEEVILAGGSTRIPKIQELVSQFFDGKVLNKTLHVDLCVAEGAALQAAMLSDNPVQEIRNMEMKDVVPLSIGMANLADDMIVFIKRNTPLPTSHTREVTTVFDQQSLAKFKLYEGERLDVTKNFFLGSMILHNVAEGAPGESLILITLTMDKSGILHLRAEEQFRRNSREIKITYNRRPENEIEYIVGMAEENEEEDVIFAKFAQEKSYLITYCEAIRYNIRVKNLEEACGHILDWCSTTRAKAFSLKVEDNKRLKELIDTTIENCEPLVKTYNFQSMPDILDM